MLTRLEAHNFKNLRGFSLDFGPFTCVAGPNGVGKSNVFDAIQFLSLLADNTLMEAALHVRGSQQQTTDLQDLFWTDGATRASSFMLAAEMIVERALLDDFGREATATSTFLRYEVEIGLETGAGPQALRRLVLLAERLQYITEGEAAARLKFPHKAKSFRKEVVANSRRSRSGYISTELAPDGQAEILVHQDGGSRGNPQRAPAGSAPKTIVATSNTSATPTVLAARREMQRWRVLALEPSAMRRADRFHDDPHVGADGSHVPATLFRLASQAAERLGGGASALLGRVASRLHELVPVTAVWVDRDDVRQLLTTTVRERRGTELPARSLSDGTLRFLTLCVIAQDPESRGLICMEEPENGIHPAKMESMLTLLQDLAVDASEVPSRDNPMRQVIIATHSPLLVGLQERDDLVFAASVTIRGAAGAPSETLRCFPLNGTWRAAQGGAAVGLGTILEYLTTPRNTQLRLPESFRS